MRTDYVIMRALLLGPSFSQETQHNLMRAEKTGKRGENEETRECVTHRIERRTAERSERKFSLT